MLNLLSGSQHDPAVPGPTDLLTELPPEIKNKIYDLVLVEPDPIYVGKGGKVYSVGHIRHRMTDEELLPLKWTIRKRAWREPGLLSVSKQFRQDTITVYYTSNHFYLDLKSSNIAAGCAWVEKHYTQNVVNQPDGVTEFGEFGLYNFDLILTSKTWGGVDSWAALSELAYNITLACEDTNYADHKESWKGVISAENKTMAIKLWEAAVLGVKAKLRGLDLDTLKEDFGDLAESMRSGSRIRWKL